MCRVLTPWYHVHVYWFKLIKFTDKSNHGTIFFQDKIYVETGHVNLTHMGIFLNTCIFYGFHYNWFFTGFLIAYHFHMMLPIFSPNLGIAILKSLQATFSVYLGFLLKYEYVLTTDEWVFFSKNFFQALACCQLKNKLWCTSSGFMKNLKYTKTWKPTFSLGPYSIFATMAPWEPL